MKQPIEKLIADLPPHLIQQVEDYVLFLRERYSHEINKSMYKFEWEGFLSPIYEYQTTLEVQKQAYTLWEDIDVSR
jgi:hypothetical protein